MQTFDGNRAKFQRAFSKKVSHRRPVRKSPSSRLEGGNNYQDLQARAAGFYFLLLLDALSARTCVELLAVT